MPAGDNIKNGVLTTRDLVELYLGTRVAVTIKESHIGPLVAWTQIIPQNPARIRYELVLENTAAGANDQAFVGTMGTSDAGTQQTYAMINSTTIVIDRDFRSDLDGVTREVWASSALGGVSISARETILTPLPVDETP